MSVALFVAFAFVVPFAEDEGISADGGGAAGRHHRRRQRQRAPGPVRAHHAVRTAAALPGLRRCPAARLRRVDAWPGAATACSCVFAVILGVSYGGYVALGPTVAAALFGVIGLGGLLGLLYLGARHRRPRRAAGRRRAGRLELASLPIAVRLLSGSSRRRHPVVRRGRDPRRRRRLTKPAQSRISRAPRS